MRLRCVQLLPMMLLLCIGCQPKSRTIVFPESAQSGSVRIASAPLPVIRDEGDKIELPGGFIPVQTIEGQQYIPIEGIMTDATFQSASTRIAAMSASPEEQSVLQRVALEQLTDKLATNLPIQALRLYPKIGFFVGWVPVADYDQLQTIKNLPADLNMSVRVYANQAEYAPQMHTDTNEDPSDAPPTGKPAANTADFSGLASMGVNDFLDSVEADTGSRVTGSRTMMGIVDTGITYNHPSFEDDAGNSRIQYMKNFPEEGKIYFNPTAKFTVSAPTSTDTEVPEGWMESDTLMVDADFIPPPSSFVMPNPSGFQNYQGAIRVSPALRQLLLDAQTPVKLGVFSEMVFGTGGDAVDLNGNGSITDGMIALLVHDPKKGYQLYLDVQGNRDFRDIEPIGDWNTTGAMVSALAEKFGFHIQQETLNDSVGQPVEVISAGIVGFDPGNHGSHVTGIAAGRRTISNDADTTQARGVAPGAKLMVNRVCANSGGCASLEALIDLAEAGAQVVNMSIGGLSPFNDGYDISSQVIDRLTTTYGTLFVISAGNSGPGNNTVGSPSVSRLALSVGATANRTMIQKQYGWPAKGFGDASDDFMMMFSSRGPTAAGGFKPEVSAPGSQLSAIQLNQAPGNRGGLDVYWGTSMAAPSATGAIALLMDAVALYNEQNTDSPLPHDPRMLKAVIMESARGFDVTEFDPMTGKSVYGRYTWIDQGLGMVNLPKAWQLLKKIAKGDPEQPVRRQDGSEVILDYQVRTELTNPFGTPYGGENPEPIAIGENPMEISGHKFGRGLWLHHKDYASLYSVSISRELPLQEYAASERGALERQLKTSADQFELKTVIYGSNQPWLRAGVLDSQNCTEAPVKDLIVVGQGAIDSPQNHLEPRDSQLKICVDRNRVARLPSGDHGAIIKAYRKVGDQVSNVPSFMIPVYLSVPNESMQGSAGYRVAGMVRAFDVDRHYLDIPEGVSYLKISLDVDPANIVENEVTGCSSVMLYSYEGVNVIRPREIGGRSGIAKNCNNQGEPNESQLGIKYERANPRPGIWNLHVFGRYTFPESRYHLAVNYAQINLSHDVIKGTNQELAGIVFMTIKSASFNAEPTTEQSLFKLDSFYQESQERVDQDQKIYIQQDGSELRSYPETIQVVTLTTGESKGNDIDLFVERCLSNSTYCQLIGSSTTATDEEQVTFYPEQGWFYRIAVQGFAIVADKGQFLFTETLTTRDLELGQLTMTQEGEGIYKVDYHFDTATSALMQDSLFTKLGYELRGQLNLGTTEGDRIINVPVLVKNVGGTPTVGLSAPEDQEEGETPAVPAASTSG